MTAIAVAMRWLIAEIAACIRSRSNRNIAIPHEPVRYRQRHRIEIMFGRLKDW